MVRLAAQKRNSVSEASVFVSLGGPCKVFLEVVILISEAAKSEQYITYEPLRSGFSKEGFTEAA